MFKKKDLFEQCLKKHNQKIFAYLDEKSLVNLAVSSKKMYLITQATLSVLSSDSRAKNTKTKKATKKNKNQNKDVLKNSEPIVKQVQVQITKTSIYQVNKKFNSEEWKRIDTLPFNNKYLQGKIQSGATFFYENQKTKQLLFMNRSLVDPNLNYNRGGFNQDLQDQMKTNMYAEMFSGEIDEVDFASPEVLRNRHKQLLEKIQKKKKQMANLGVINYQKQLVNGISCNKIAVILCFGGSFSFGIFQKGKCTLHKSDKKYVCRKKAGERQLNKDKQSGSQICSMGSQIRRDQQKKHIANVSQILTQNREAIQNCELVFLQAPGLNRLFIINDSQTLSGVKGHLRSVCLTAKKANYTQVEAIFSQITKVSLVNIKQATNQQSKNKNL